MSTPALRVSRRIARFLVPVCAATLAVGHAPASAAQAVSATASEQALPAATRAAAQGAKSVSTRGWRTLKGPKGFRVRAPKGYRLRVVRGAYEVAAARSKVSIVGLQSADSLSSVAEGLLGVVPPDAGNADRLTYRIALKGGKQGQVTFQRVPGGVAVITVAPRGKSRSVSGSEVRRLGTIVGTAKGIRLTTLPKTTTQTVEAEIPLKPFTTPDGTAKANVPDAAGWRVSGQQGIVEGGHPDFGGFAFGVAVPFLVPQAFCSPCGALRAPFLPAGAAIEQAWPLFLRSAGVAWDSVRVVAQVPGSAGMLGPGIDSGMYQFTALSGGRTIVGYIVAGTFAVSADTWYLYYSFVATFEGVSGSVGDALMRTWQSWDASVDQQRRQQLTFIAQQETVNIVQQATEYRRRVFDKDNFNWVQLIRGSNPILAPVDPNVIGDGGQTLVRLPDNRLFDFEGNEFQAPEAGG